MQVIFLNMKTSEGVETVDEFMKETGQSLRDFYKYVREMKGEYRLSGMNVYSSQKCTNDWRNS